MSTRGRNIEPWGRLVVCLAALFFGLQTRAAEDPSRSPASDTPRPGLVRAPLPAIEVKGLPLATVFYDLRGRSGITGGDQRARDRIEEAFGLRPGSPFDPQVAEVGLMKVRRLEFVRQADFTVYESSRPGYLVVAVSVLLGSQRGEAGPGGMLAGNARDLPILYRDERTMLRLVLNGGIGVFSDGNPWFGNATAFTAGSPIALSPADGSRATWYESSVEYGIGGVVQLWQGNFWAYGASSALTSFATGQDLFRADTRSRTAIEDAYVGILWHPGASPWVFDASVGRQNWQLNDGFLFSQFAGAANAGPIPGLFLNPRTAYEMTAVLKAHNNRFRFEAFHLNPSEIEFLESDTSFVGFNTAYQFPADWEASFAYYEVPQSRTAFDAGAGGQVPREGQQTANLRAASTRMLGVEGLEFGAEIAYQTNRDVEWDAWAYYGRIGYGFRGLPWTPNLSYRYASFSGDDPDTRTYERFDAPLSSGLDTWVQGVNVRKVQSNSNLDTHRIRLNLAPSPKLSLTFDYWWLFANEPAAAPSRIAQEVDVGIRWSINPELFFLGVAGLSLPDDRLRDQAGSDLDPWTTLQASLFWTF
jgi:hypothetical protein